MPKKIETPNDIKVNGSSPETLVKKARLSDLGMNWKKIVKAKLAEKKENNG